MRKLASSVIACLSLLDVAFAASSAAQEGMGPSDDQIQGPAEEKANFPGSKIILNFHTMYGVDGPFVGDTNPVRDVVGDELPWEIANFIHGRLDTKGHLTIVVRGLVFKDDPSVPPDLVGRNDEEEFRGLVSCLSEDGDQVVTRNVVTEGFPADVNGNSFIRAVVELPNPCVAPIVMVLAGSEDKWFAMTGFEEEED
jgi:hypothetical protein